MLRRLEGLRPAPRVAFTFAGRPMQARQGSSVAAALLENGVLEFRRALRAPGPRAPFCLMGVCFECLVVIDGRRHRQACLTRIAEGMAIEPERADR
jgi:predicted molibdopterin-dependent oxidoreductase YjgC